MHTELQEHLLELPLFQGMSRNDLEQILSETKFRQLSFARGKVIVHEGETCNKLYFLVKGQITTTCHSDDKSYSITETLAAPNILQPERIFGLMQRYTRTFAAKTNCDLICLGKKEVMLMSDNYEIFRLNLLNIICTLSQRSDRQMWKLRPKGIRHKIARFIEERSLRPAGEKIVNIKMERLAEEISESRLNVSKALKAMNDEGVISLRRGEFCVHAFERMLM